MRDGGSDGRAVSEKDRKGNDEHGDATPENGAGATALRRLTGPLRAHRLLSSAVAVAVVAAVAVPLVLAGSGADAEPCTVVSDRTRALAEDPAAATEALDPGDSLDRIGGARQLLAHDGFCGDGARILGRVIDAGTRASGPGKPHTMAQARSAYAVAAALGAREIPARLAPAVARMIAEYEVDALRDDDFGGIGADDATGPAAPPAEATLDSHGWVRLGRFLSPGEAHATFEYGDQYRDVTADIPELVVELAKNPEAFAILYDAHRAQLAHYLERLTRQGGDPSYRPGDKYGTPTTWTDNDLQDLADHIGALMALRSGYAKDRTIQDVAAFDASVRKHSRGTFRPASHQLTTRPPMGDIADRAPSGPLRGDVMDGRRQMFTVLDRWAKERGVPSERAAAMRQLMDDFYVRALWLVSVQRF
ncbi:hypothetical protein ACIHCV_16360 [Streptomyces sp. NPDC051956]|uniref:hypothetical protein n=1 Tax=Streptomyces sp. NPDC051956 TaxID=3365677 RepID=UPI0037D87B9D